MNYKRKIYWKDRRVLITGYEGFLGSWLCKILVGYGAKIIGIDKVKNRPISILQGLRKNIIGIKGDIANLRAVKDIAEKYKPQTIFHLAAESIVAEAHNNPLEAFKSNIEGTWNILEASRNKEFIESIVIASSDKAYGKSDKLPYTEDTPLRANHPYDVSKTCADLLAGMYAYTYHLPVGVNRCGNVFGPGDFHFSRIVPETINSALRDEFLLIRSNGRFTRDYVYVQDIINGYILLAEKIHKLKLYGEAFNFSNQKPISVLDIVRIIYELIGKKPKYKILNQARYEIKEQYLSAKKAKQILGWEPKFSLKEGLLITINWYKKLLKNTMGIFVKR